MALILTDYDLSGGDTTSTEVVAPNNWRVSATIEDAPASQFVRLDLEAEDAAGNWFPLTYESGLPIHLTIIGNKTRSINPIVVNAANGRVKVHVPKAGGVGTINIDSINA